MVVVAVGCTEQPVVTSAPAKPADKTVKRTATIVDGPAYRASLIGKPHLPVAGLPDKTGESTCLEAIQIVGHDGESLMREWDLFGGTDLDASLALVKSADLYVGAADKILKNDRAFCEHVNRDLVRDYPARLDEHDHMSTGRLGQVLRMLKITAASKPMLEAEAAKDVSR